MIPGTSNGDLGDFLNTKVKVSPPRRLIITSLICQTECGAKRAGKSRPHGTEIIRKARGCQRACSCRHCAADAEIPVAFRSRRPSRPILLCVSALTGRTAGYVTRTSGGVGGALSDGRPYPDLRVVQTGSKKTVRQYRAQV